MVVRRPYKPKIAGSSPAVPNMPLRQMVRHRVLVPIIAGSNPAGAVPPWLSWQSDRLVSDRLWVQIPPAA